MESILSAGGILVVFVCGVFQFVQCVAPYTLDMSSLCVGVCGILFYFESEAGADETMRDSLKRCQRRLKEFIEFLQSLQGH